MQVTGLTNVAAIAAGYCHALALKTDGTVYAWGLNGNGQLGNGSTSNSSVPVQATGLGTVSTLAGGGQHSVILETDGTVHAWGRNFFGQLGNGTTSNSTSPVQVSGLNLHSDALVVDYTIAAVAGSHGSISPAGNVVVQGGTDITFTMTPAAGYEVASVLVDGFSAGQVSSYTFTNVSSAHTITVAFSLIPPTCIADPILVEMQYPYSSVQSAYLDIPSGNSETIYMQDGMFTEGLILSRDVTVTLKGGYDCYYTDPPAGETVISSSVATMTISGGTVIADGIVLR